MVLKRDIIPQVQHPYRSCFGLAHQMWTVIHFYRINICQMDSISVLVYHRFYYSLTHLITKGSLFYIDISRDIIFSSNVNMNWSKEIYLSTNFHGETNLLKTALLCMCTPCYAAFVFRLRLRFIGLERIFVLMTK